MPSPPLLPLTYGSCRFPLNNWMSEGRVSLPTHLWHVPWVGAPGEPGGPGGPGGPGEPLAGLAGPANLWYTQGASLAGPRTPGGGKPLAHPACGPGGFGGEPLAGLAGLANPWWPANPWRTSGGPGEPLAAPMVWAWQACGQVNLGGLVHLGCRPGGPGELMAAHISLAHPWRA